MCLVKCVIALIPEVHTSRVLLTLHSLLFIRLACTTPAFSPRYISSQARKKLLYKISNKMQSGSKSIHRSILFDNKYRHRKEKIGLFSTSLNATRFNTLLSRCVTSMTWTAKRITERVWRKIKLAVDRLALKIQWSLTLSFDGQGEKLWAILNYVIWDHIL